MLPFAGSLSGDDGYTDEELKLVNESRKILELPDLRVSATCVRVPVRDLALRGGLGAHARADRAGRGARAAGRRGRHHRRRRPRGERLPDGASTPTGKDDVFVGRIRRDLGDPNALALWVVSDNLRKGAATNAVQIAELLVRDRLLRSAA